MPVKDYLVEAKSRFSGFLEEKAYRKTNERFIILEEIYSLDGHFDAEALYDHLRKKKRRISRATVYNTLELLVSCDLVVKHHFRDTITHYEKSYGYKQHDHMICISCGKVVEFCDPRIQPIKSKMGELLEFTITSHALNIYGLCGTCRAGQIS